MARAPLLQLSDIALGALTASPSAPPLIGRDDEYLKAPSDALRVSRFGEALNVDHIAMPLFTSDEYLTGERLSFFAPGIRYSASGRPTESVREFSFAENGLLASVQDRRWKLVVPADLLAGRVSAAWRLSVQFREVTRSH